MPDLLLPLPAGYDAGSQALVGTLAAALDDQLRRVKAAVAGLTVDQLEWQPRRGHNTVGMLLVHLGAVEVSWLVGAGQGNLRPPEVQARTAELLGLGGGGDGMPLAADGSHPGWMRGKEIGWYLDLLDRARTLVHGAMRSWSDADLDLVLEGGGFRIDRRWMVYHVLEHLAAHAGQILLILHHERDAGVLETPPTRNL